MGFKIIISLLAQKEIENAIDYYSLYSVNAPENFISALSEAYITLGINPFFRVRYKDIRALKINNFPYSLYFTVNEERKMVRVLSCFHNKKHPNKRPRV